MGVTFLIFLYFYFYPVDIGDSNTKGRVRGTYGRYGEPSVTDTNQEKQQGKIQVWKVPGIKIDVSLTV